MQLYRYMVMAAEKERAIFEMDDWSLMIIEKTNI